jgi:hypothetical protein
MRWRDVLTVTDASTYVVSGSFVVPVSISLAAVLSDYTYMCHVDRLLHVQHLHAGDASRYADSCLFMAPNGRHAFTHVSLAASRS